MPRLTQAECNRAIGMADMEASQRQIARTFNCSQAAISNLLSHCQQTGQAQDHQRSGRPRVTTPTSGQSSCKTDLWQRCLQHWDTPSADEQSYDDSAWLVAELSAPSIEWSRPFYTVNADYNRHELYVGGSGVIGKG